MAKLNQKSYFSATKLIFKRKNEFFKCNLLKSLPLSGNFFEIQKYESKNMNATSKEKNLRDDRISGYIFRKF